ncbi:hypothetical protein I1E95_16555 [Synechococcus sp. CBW1107]|uniref:hypothetical protein n=1 Tax=Synechococcus sp. CBW1107 TaxID=2789857 RepID=UPI0018CDAC2B|nr:hypothetical protein [Synechococcus sp. CBW1107]QPN56634.1 hypothetical protein I1E95_16555 [Synechococcus sp. CBW1107]
MGQTERTTFLTQGESGARPPAKTSVKANQSGPPRAAFLCDVEAIIISSAIPPVHQDKTTLILLVGRNLMENHRIEPLLKPPGAPLKKTGSTFDMMHPLGGFDRPSAPIPATKSP